jgi:cobalamin synthase
MATMTRHGVDSQDVDSPSPRQRPTRAEIIRDLRSGAGRVANVLAVIVTAAAAALAMILVLHIVFVLFKATPTNGIVKHVNSYANDIAGPFRTMFAFKSKAKPNIKLTETVNYGIAALVYLAGGRVLAGLLRKLAP